MKIDKNVFVKLLDFVKQFRIDHTGWHQYAVSGGAVYFYRLLAGSEIRLVYHGAPFDSGISGRSQKHLEAFK